MVLRVSSSFSRPSSSLLAFHKHKAYNLGGEQLGLLDELDQVVLEDGELLLLATSHDEVFLQLADHVVSGVVLGGAQRAADG